MSLRRIAAVLAVVALGACSSDTTDPTDNDLNVSGTWSGQANLVAGSESETLSLKLVLAQNGSTVTGTANEVDSTDPADGVTGTLSGSTLTLTGTPPSAPCSAYHWSLTLNATASALTITNASGTICDAGSGTPSLHTLTAASGTLHK